MFESVSQVLSALALLTPGVLAAGLAMAALCLLGHFYTHHLYIQPINLADPWPGPPVRPAARSGPSRLRHHPRRLIVFLIDGLGEEAARDLPNLGRLRSRGAAARVLVGRPSFTDPGMTCFATGLPPSLSGIRINGPIPDELDHDSVAKVAARAGLRVSAAVDEYAPLRRLLFLPGSTRHGSAEELVKAEAPEDGPGELIWLYTVKVDKAGHWHGARSEAYAEACRAADAELGAVLDRLDLERDALVVLSDHGHRPRGGHGGPEREIRRAVLVAGGCGVAARAPDEPLPAVAMHRIAPTLTAWLGLERPRGAVGEPLRELFGGVSSPGANRVPTAEAREREARGRSRRRLGATAATLGLLWLGALGLSAAGALDVTLRDAAPVLAYVAMTLGLTGLAGWPLSYSMPRGGVGYVAEINLYGQLSAWLAAWLSRPERMVAESLVGAALFLGVYALHAAFLGRDRRWLEPPPTGYLFILLSSVMFFFGLVSAFRLAWHLPTLLTAGAV